MPIYEIGLTFYIKVYLGMPMENTLIRKINTLCGVINQVHNFLRSIYMTYKSI